MIDALTPETRHARGRLWRVELDTLPERAVREALEHLARWAVPLSPGALGLPRVDDARYTDLAITISDLISYARTGRAADWQGGEDAEDALLSVSVLYSAPLGDSVVPSDWIDRTDLDGDRALLADVARACLARVRLERREPIPRTWLAALAGCDERTIKRAIERGELATARGARGRPGKRPQPVASESARAWLVARGVEGVS